MPRFEYLQETFIDTFDFTNPEYAKTHGLVTSSEKQFQDFAKAAGLEGWELVSAIKTSSVSGFTCFFKRQFPETLTIDGLVAAAKTATAASLDVPSRKKGGKKAEVTQNLVVGPANPSGQPTHTCVTQGGACEICGE